jgi:hypothetical protein
MFQSIVYVLCFLTSAACAWLLFTSFLKVRQRLLAWSALCFGLIAAANLLVFVDIILLPDVDLLLLRHLMNFAGIAVMIYGLVVELD